MAPHFVQLTNNRLIQTADRQPAQRGAALKQKPTDATSRVQNSQDVEFDEAYYVPDKKLQVDLMVEQATDLGWGAFLWPVCFKLTRAASNDGWIIQKITRTFTYKDAKKQPDPDVYFEAWEVAKGEMVARNQRGYDDIFWYLPHVGHASGTMTVTGSARFFPGKLPTTFAPGRIRSAGRLWSSKGPPDYWIDKGTAVHSLKTTWTCPHHDLGADAKTMPRDQLFAWFCDHILSGKATSSVTAFCGKLAQKVDKVTDRKKLLQFMHLLDEMLKGNW
jgi:hypothetical protein